MRLTARPVPTVPTVLGALAVVLAAVAAVVVGAGERPACGCTIEPVREVRVYDAQRVRLGDRPVWRLVPRATQAPVIPNQVTAAVSLLLRSGSPRSNGWLRADGTARFGLGRGVVLVRRDAVLQVVVDLIPAPLPTRSARPGRPPVPQSVAVRQLVATVRAATGAADARVGLSVAGRPWLPAGNAR